MTCLRAGTACWAFCPMCPLHSPAVNGGLVPGCWTRNLQPQGTGRHGDMEETWKTKEHVGNELFHTVHSGVHVAQKSREEGCPFLSFPFSVSDRQSSQGARCCWRGWTWSLGQGGGWRQTPRCYLSKDGPQHLTVRVPSLSLAAAQERIFTAVLCVSLAETWVDFGAENYGALDSGNLLSTKRPEALSDVRREHSCWGFWRVFGNTCKAYFMTVEWDKY